VSLTQQVLDFTRRTGRYPNKKLGQNFLIDANIMPKIAKIADLTDDDSVLEVGPGLGFLTQELLPRAKKVVAVEIDTSLYAELESRFAHVSNLVLLRGNILQQDLSYLIQTFGLTKVVANLPYNISGSILWELMRHRERLETLVLMIQTEMADRLVAHAGSKSYSALTVWTTYHAQIEVRRTLSPQQFFPIPKVSSAVVKIQLRSQPKVEVLDKGLFRQVIAGSFHTRRKMLRNSIKASNVPIDTSTLDLAMVQVGIDSKRRGETLSVSEFVALTNSIHQLLTS
jgi:16S rRNA (adenine1518-N6/adenine1519-N6)-dimethyltransferase